MQPTGCMDYEPQPSRGVPCYAFPGRPTNSGSTLPRTAHLDGGVIGNHQFITSHSKCTLASFDIRLPPWLCPACLPNTSSIPAPIQPTIAMTTTHIHQLWLTRPPSTCSSSASEDHPQAPVVTQQQQQYKRNINLQSYNLAYRFVICSDRQTVIFSISQCINTFVSSYHNIL